MKHRQLGPKTDSLGRVVRDPTLQTSHPLVIPLDRGLRAAMFPSQWGFCGFVAFPSLSCRNGALTLEVGNPSFAGFTSGRELPLCQDAFQNRESSLSMCSWSSPG